LSILLDLPLWRKVYDLPARCGVQIKILYFSGCPNWETAVDRVRSVVAELGRTDLTMRVEDVHRMAHLPSEWAGSPTVLVDGRDPFIDRGRQPIPARDVCRVYVTEAGFDGAPTVDQLRTVLTLALKDDTTLRRDHGHNG
jgi:hypothetical protein